MGKQEAAKKRLFHNAVELGKQHITPLAE